MLPARIFSGSSASTPEHAAAPRDEADLEERLSRPPATLTAALSDLSGGLLILGAGGKMGPSLARMAKRARPDLRVVAVSRWSDVGAARMLEESGVEVLTADLLDPASLAQLPDMPNIVFMAGQKFGTSGNPAMTWAMNAGVPMLVAERFAGARIAVFSTGNVYSLSAPGAGGAREDDALAPIGEYAYSCLARERIFTAAAERHGSPTSVIRLNYAHDLRYGVLTDLALKVRDHTPIDLRMSWVNVIWQGDANAFALASLARASTPAPFVLNVAGREALRVRDLAAALGDRLGEAPVFQGEEASDALLSNASRMHDVLDVELMPPDTLMDWVVGWMRHGGRLLNKPTGFEKRDGRF
jgi:nucleoside-diphosphate-sugar epimerase